jgi:pimeloyl-ACP methyl ester carboxylesterase
MKHALALGMALAISAWASAAGPNRPQTPAGPFPYATEDVTVPAGDHTLAGTLTLPEAARFGDGPYPAVVFITGSGPQDRDETIFDHKPFAVLADALARAGVASLRCDDRGVGASTGDFAAATTLDFAEDARAGVAYLRAHSRIDPARVGLIGHSEGGLIAPMLAADDEAIAAIVLLAGPGVPGSDILVLQNQMQLAAMKPSPEQNEALASAARALFDAIADQTNTRDDEVDALAGLLTAQARIQGVTPDAAKIRAMADRSLDQTMSAWMRTFLVVDPRASLRHVRCPVLAINGSLDLQVDAAQNIPEIARALAEAGNTDHTLMVLPGLNHMLQPATLGTLPEYAAIETTLDPGVVDLVVGWVTARMAEAPTGAPGHEAGAAD